MPHTDHVSFKFSDTPTGAGATSVLLDRRNFVERRKNETLRGLMSANSWFEYVQSLRKDGSNG